MTTLSLRAKYPAPAWRGFARIIAAVTAAVETVLDVFGEAADLSAAARRRFPSAD